MLLKSSKIFRNVIVTIKDGVARSLAWTRITKPPILGQLLGLEVQVATTRRSETSKQVGRVAVAFGDESHIW